MRNELRELYGNYFAAEKEVLQSTRDSIRAKTVSFNELAGRLNKEFVETKKHNDAIDTGTESAELTDLEKKITQLRAEKDILARELGKIEGMLEQSPETSGYVVTDSRGVDRCRYCGGQVIQKDINHIATEEHDKKTKELKLKRSNIEEKLSLANKNITAFEETIFSKRQEISEKEKKAREGDRLFYEIKTREADLKSLKERLKMEEESFAVREADYKREVGEAAILVGKVELELGHRVSKWTTWTLGVQVVDRENMRRKIERLKIKIEDIGGGSKELMKEYEDTQARDTHMEKEIEDLKKSANLLTELMNDLGSTIEEKFKQGISKINQEFEQFFRLLFGGGEAQLRLVKVEKRNREIDELLIEETDLSSETLAMEEPGIEIDVSLPRKKVKGLDMLSGGERALTSIALIFAISQVNPPPFLVLDETDAALDEANSKKYADMIEKLAQKSQLILITHNRETMSRANVLYGVTMGSDSASKLLSIKFDDAETYAK